MRLREGDGKRAVRVPSSDGGTLTALMRSSESGSYGRRRPPRDSNPDLPPQGGRAAVTPAGRRTGVPEPAYATIHSGWVCGRPGASGLRHAKVVCHGVTVRRAHPADTMGTPTGPAPVTSSRTAMRRGATPMPRCMIRRDDRERRLRPFPQPVGRLFPPSPRRTGAGAARGDSGNSSHCWVGELSPSRARDGVLTGAPTAWELLDPASGAPDARLTPFRNPALCGLMSDARSIPALNRTGRRG